MGVWMGSHHEEQEFLDEASWIGDAAEKTSSWFKDACEARCWHADDLQLQSRRERELMFWGSLLSENSIFAIKHI
jgi:hypothetical protein